MGVFSRVVLCLVLLVPLIFFGTAAAQTTYTATPISAGPLSGGVSNVRFEVLPSGGGGTRYGNALVPVSKSSLGKMTVGAMSRHPGIHLAIMAYVALHENWEWDALEHRFREPGETIDPTTIPNCLLHCNDAPQAQCVRGGTPTGMPAGTYIGSTAIYPPYQGACAEPEQTGQLHLNNCGLGYPSCGGYLQTHRFSALTTYSTDPIEMPGELVPHETVGNRLEQAPETTTNQITNNVINQNNTTIQNEWNELHLTRVNIETSFENENPDGQWTQTPGAGDTTINNTFSMDFPIFCDWAGVVCSFIEWFQETEEPPEDPDLPTEEIDDVWDEWDSGMPSSGSCPAPHTTEFMGNAIIIPFDDFCYGLSTYFRPIFIALALFAAGFILVGARQ